MKLKYTEVCSWRVAVPVTWEKYRDRPTNIADTNKQCYVSKRQTLLRHRHTMHTRLRQNGQRIGACFNLGLLTANSNLGDFGKLLKLKGHETPDWVQGLGPELSSF